MKIIDALPLLWMLVTETIMVIRSRSAIYVMMNINLPLVIILAPFSSLFMRFQPRIANNSQDIESLN